MLQQPLDPSELEPELEALFLRWVPGIASQWRSASSEDIAALERIAGSDLPRCYQWLLLRLGWGWAEHGYRSLNFSARHIVDGHLREAFPSHEGMMCIADDSDEQRPQLRYYDLAHPAKGDAPVFVVGPEEDYFELEFDTLREFIASAVFDNYRRRPMPVGCTGLVVAEGEDEALPKLEPIFDAFGFQAPVPCGPTCLLLDNGTIAMSSYQRPAEHVPSVVSFSLGGQSEGGIRKFLGAVSTSAGLTVERLSWTP